MHGETKREKILLTGGAGFIGSHVAARLLDEGRQVSILDNLDPFYDPALKRRNLEMLSGRPGLRWIEADIRDPDALERLDREESPFDALIHLAARAGVRASVREPLLCADVNVNGTIRLLEFARTRKIGRFIFASSSSVYGSRNRIPFREDEAIDRPASPYAATKAAGEMLCWTWHQLYGMDISCLRFFTVYGPRQRPEMAIHHFTRLIDRGEEVPVFGDGTARRDFTFIDDIVAGVLAALDRCRGFRIYNLGNSATVEVREMIRLIAEALGKPARVRNLPPEPGDVPVTCASIDLAGQELGFRPTTALAQGIRHFVDWYRTEGRGAGALKA
jgi:UDP-glucuronate 4-epimerase